MTSISLISFSGSKPVPVNNAFSPQKEINFPHVMSSPLYLDVDTCWSKPFRGAAVMDGLVAMEEHKLIGCGGYHTVYWRHGFRSVM